MSAFPNNTFINTLLCIINYIPTAGMYITEFNSLIWESWLLIINGISTYEKDNVIKNDINICPAVANVGTL